MKSNININQFFNGRLALVIFALAFALPVSFNSCNDEAFLEEKVYSTLLTETWYSSQEGIKQGIAGLYTIVRQRWYWGDENQDEIAIWLGALGTDVAFHGENPNNNRFLCDYTTYMTPAGDPGGTITHHWRYSFELISRANYLIDACDKLPETLWKNDKQKDVYIAEAKFFRAWAYRNLTSFYGRVPVIDEPITSSKVDFERDPLEKAYALMEADLLTCTTDLPVKGAEEGTGRITQGAAWQLLCEVYLAQQKYQDAVNAASRLIDGGTYRLMTERFGGKNSVWGSGDVFWDLHALGNQFSSANTETIWAMAFPYKIEDGRSNHRAGRCWGNAYFRLAHTPDMPNARINGGSYAPGEGLAHWSAFMGEERSGGQNFPHIDGSIRSGYSDTLGRGVSWIHPTNLTSYYIWEGNWDNDYRNARHMFKRDFYYDNPKSSFHGKRVNMKEDYAEWYTIPSSEGGRDLRNDTCQYIFPFILKKFDPCNIETSPGTSGQGNSFKDIYIMRLAETYLSRAEAYIGLGQYQQAVDDINVVRRRSNAHEITLAEIFALPVPTPTPAGFVWDDKTKVLYYLLDERARELYSEECRHFVLRRTGTLLDRNRIYNNNPAKPAGSGQNIMKKHILWPIPQSELNLNIENVWEQNPGYDPSHPDYNAI